VPQQQETTIVRLQGLRVAERRPTGFEAYLLPDGSWPIDVHPSGALIYRCERGATLERFRLIFHSSKAGRCNSLRGLIAGLSIWFGLELPEHTERV
jgi:hypothetical protein